MYSLRKKIARNLSLNLLVVMIGLLIAMYFFVQQLLHDYILTHLQDDAESIALVIYEDPAEGWKIDPGRMSTVYSRVRSGHYFYVAIEQQVIISRSLFDAGFPGVDDKHPPGSDYQADGPGDERWMVWHQLVMKNGQAIGIWVAEDIAPLQNQLLQYSAVIVGLIVVVAVLLFYLQQRTLRQAFEVFDWLRMNLTAIRQMESKRSGVAMPLEVIPLVTEIEKLAEHLSQRIVRTRNAMGNLAHELKRPLQLLVIQQENGQGAETRDTLDEIRNILERELRRARISGASSAVSVLHIAREMDYMTGVLRKIYPDIDIEVEIENQFETPGLDRDDMLELIGNLLDNSCKFARARARFTAGAVDGQLDLGFEDDGHGLESEQLQQLNRRGQRLDESVAGHGLGLGICRDILDYYRGSLTFARSVLGGLRVTVKIPLT
jgi:signal transduction histidine kinase